RAQHDRAAGRPAGRRIGMRREGYWRCVALAGALLASAPAYAQQEQATRGQILDRLPYWPGYWVGADQVGTPISGIGRPQAGEAPRPTVNDVIAIWGNSAPWNEEGRRRVAEALRTMGGRKGLGWGYPLMMAS